MKNKAEQTTTGTQLADVAAELNRVCAERERIAAAVKESQGIISQSVVGNLDHHSLADQRIALRFLGMSDDPLVTKPGKDFQQSASVRKAIETIQRLSNKSKQILAVEEWLPAMYTSHYAREDRSLSEKYAEAQAQFNNLFLETQRLEKKKDGLASKLLAKFFPGDGEKTRELCETILAKKKFLIKLERRRLVILIEQLRLAERYKIVNEIWKAASESNCTNAETVDQLVGKLHKVGPDGTNDLCLERAIEAGATDIAALMEAYKLVIPEHDRDKTRIDTASASSSSSASQADSPGEFPGSMLGRVAMVIINYEGDRDSDLQRAVVMRLMPLAKGGCGFTPYCNAKVPQLQPDEPTCGMIRADGGFPKTGVSLNSHIAYIASKDAFPPGHSQEYSTNQIGYWIGSEMGKKVHAILLLG